MLFLQPVASHVRYQRRLENLAELGATVDILSFDRDYYAGRDIQRGYVSLGCLEHGHYLKRIPVLLRALRTVRRALRAYNVVYTFGLDMALLACVARIGIRPRPKLIYEVGDIVEVLLRPGILGRAMRSLEGLLLLRANMLVTTSEAFIREYFKPVHGHRLPATLVIENKPKLVGGFQARPVTRPSPPRLDPSASAGSVSCAALEAWRSSRIWCAKATAASNCFCGASEWPD
jgi:succinoglycan biosynthesis protein ExoL